VAHERVPRWSEVDTEAQAVAPVAEPQGGLEPPRRHPPTAVGVLTPEPPPEAPAPLEGDPYTDAPTGVRRVAWALLAAGLAPPGLALVWQGRGAALGGLALLAAALQLAARAATGAGLGAAFRRGAAAPRPRPPLRLLHWSAIPTPAPTRRSA
jgi:hypothetical protein